MVPPKETQRISELQPDIVVAQAKENIAKAMCVDSYDVLTRASGAERENIIHSAAARIKRWNKKSPRVKFPWAGSAYLMLGRKVNVEGKFVK